MKIQLEDLKALCNHPFDHMIQWVSNISCLRDNKIPRKIGASCILTLSFELTLLYYHTPVAALLWFTHTSSDHEPFCPPYGKRACFLTTAHLVFQQVLAQWTSRWTMNSCRIFFTPLRCFTPHFSPLPPFPPPRTWYQPSKNHLELMCCTVKPAHHVPHINIQDRIWMAIIVFNYSWCECRRTWETHIISLRINALDCGCVCIRVEAITEVQWR